ncbi:ImmA/IrrE family metallo-endopeptidase [Ralstonia pseudosolanacearum]|uniref:ImmA/IrrE family metallo-endopeptidase n=1 Tax=Ralstonia pseudosolanacearum TaxID=1310165 RepID=UPI001FF92051|nr:ImmA/IrrE family metallo-endopeptidase [Ralstonia pseudosolanacearum]
MKADHSFSPIWAVPPGRTVVDLLSARGVSRDELADSIALVREDLDDLIDGTAQLSESVASRLGDVFGTSADFWIRREEQYREQLASLHVKADVADASYSEWLKALPLAEMARFGWFGPGVPPTDKLTACLDFFDVPNLDAWSRDYDDVKRAVAFRASAAHPVNVPATTAWLRQGERESERIECSPWDPAKFSSALAKARALTRTKDPQVFVPALQALCAMSGVAVVIVRAPSGCRASGATFFSAPDKAVLLLSFRYLTDDQFWFSFFHEAGHLLLHTDRDSLILEAPERTTSKMEAEANEFAAKTLLPLEFNRRLPEVAGDARAILLLAREAGIAPGIIVGQLQHRGLVKHQHLNKLKIRYSW